MSKKANPTVIGTFIVVGLAFGVGAVLLFSSSRLFAPSKEFILYFDATLTGLDPGAVVKFRGVTIGAVKEVLIHFNQAPTDTSLPVIIELNEDLLKTGSAGTFNLTDDVQFETYVKRGLRGKLDTQSLLTGLLYVNLEFLPNAPPVYHQAKKAYPEIPTAPVDVQIFRVDFASIAQKLNALLARLDTSLGEVQVKEINRRLTDLLTSLDTLARSPGLTNALTSAQQTLEEFRLLSGQMRARIDTLGDSAEETLVESRRTLTELREGIQEARDLLAPHAPLQRDLSEALNQLSEAGRSVEALAEFLRQHPNAVLSGRKNSAPKP